MPNKETQKVVSINGEAVEDIYIDLRTIQTIKLCMHIELITKGFICLSADDDYVIVDERRNDLIDYIRENSSDALFELTIGD
jgi:hypothetical protein